ncbi:PepSY-associated TM helix domain-containing protein [Spirilliplanes yamanashiensis]|uniref:Membrane protein n=1 Tax=Spirilliplanes yamanashiensis TaxID=42233 RepID=A0A8J3YCQ4_9ACTN|nr:PepSY domain-containing protein [Spirilliplanes yamanashiensis]MDP9816164.1 putative iron-regulated membrane protein [Spirilliplanes yamanashiensis]GIJ05689.1 membrane protein [Spirilliplanes yamanashiensis]
MTVTSELTESPEPAGAAPGPPPREGRRPSAFGALLLRLHFYAGVLVAPFLVVAAVTGLLFTVTPQLDAVLYRDQLTVDRPGGAALPLAGQIAAARAAHPDGALAAVQPGGGDDTTRVVFSLPELGEKQHTVYVDPSTGRVQGTLTTWWGATPVTTWLDDLHRNLHLGAAGRHYSELAASWLWVLALGGVVLWWRRRRRVAALFAPDLGARRGVRRTRGWHAATGVWLSAGLLVLAATGLTWSRFAGGNFTAALDALDARTPELSTGLAGAPAAVGGHHGGGAVTAAPVDPAAADTVLGVARGAGLTGPVELTVPADAASAWTVTGVDNTWPVGLDRVAVDPATGAVTARSDFADWPLLAQLSKLGVQAHMGKLFGVANQVLLAALAIGLLCVIVWGYRMWWQRRPTRAGRRALAGAPPARRAWIGLPGWAIMGGVVAVFGLAWALPLFGVPLAAFLLIDAAVGAVRRRRPAAPVSPAPAGR